MGDLVLAGGTSGTITLTPTAVAGSNTLTLPASTGTVLTNKTVGTVLQVVSSKITTNTTTSSTSYVDTSVSLAITPSSSSNKILILLNPSFYINRNGAATSYGDMFFNIVRTSTEVNYARIAINFGANTWADYIVQSSLMHLDSPSTTSSTTYKMQIYTSQAGVSIQNNLANYPSTITLMEIAA